MTEPAALRVADLPKGRTQSFDITPDAEARAALASALGINALRKLRFHGTLAPLGRHDWRINADLGATAVQDCVVTLAPVTTRIDTRVERRFLSDMPAPSELAPTPEDGVEMPEDDTNEPLGDVIDLARVLHEALALALPDYPRAEGADLARAQAAPPGAAPLEDADLKPFAGLAGLKRKLEENGGDES
ncbi:hypothetical protein DC366_00610 [Pelagivirga sediminicola]|uniref:DUF177 domain-containing protein n=1 Tax=Pelagivirga sediminicola TaxID=2170575 RepID=A0A2T7GC96_9RHOB|nr:hypothetical protein DC366_00610 [Pelagivirga sediminicola]